MTVVLTTDRSASVANVHLQRLVTYGDMVSRGGVPGQSPRAIADVRYSLAPILLSAPAYQTKNDGDGLGALGDTLAYAGGTSAALSGYKPRTL